MKHIKIILKVISTSLITAVFYLMFVPLLRAVSRSEAIDEIIDVIIQIPTAVWVIPAILMMLVYVLLYILLFHVLGGKIKKSLSVGCEYRGIVSDIIRFGKSELAFFLTVLLVNVLCWAIFEFRLSRGRLFFQVILIIFTPLCPLSMFYSPSLDILAFILDPFMMYLFYVVDLALMRKRTYNKLYVKKK